MKYRIDANINVERELKLAIAEAQFKGARRTKEIKSINADYDKQIEAAKEVDLHDLTYDQRVECETLISGTMMDVGGSLKIVNPERYFQARTKICMYGLGAKTTEELNAYSSEELSEISNEVLGRATAGTNPTA